MTGIQRLGAASGCATRCRNIFDAVGTVLPRPSLARKRARAVRAASAPAVLQIRLHAGHSHGHDGHHHHHHPKQDRLTVGPKAAESAREAPASSPDATSRPTAPAASAAIAESPDLTAAGAFKYAADLVRRADYDHYLISLFQPSPSARNTYVTLRAFNVELAQVRDIVSNPLIGRMRMQFWRDTIEECFQGRPRKTPVAVALGEVLKTTQLSKLWFTRIINERDANLDVEQYISVKDMEKYCENTSSALLYLHLDSLGVKNSLADHAASHLGKASGIATLLKGTPYQAKERRVYLPGEILSKHGVSQEDLYRSGPDAKGLADSVFDIATIANNHAQTARKLMETPEFPKRAIPALLSLIPTENFLATLELANFNIFDSRVHQRRWNWPAQLWWRARSLFK
ncbi:isoprenoid synthase domain-containing protein [Hyaloraphidium curvatum]|nr:isoprenoid synthase domain-containing protein [Hyaloraphidium curvatum]